MSTSHMSCSQYRPLGGQGAPNSIKNLRSRKSGAVTSGRHIAEIPRMHTQDTCPTSIDHLCKRWCNEERVCHETDFGAADPSERLTWGPTPGRCLHNDSERRGGRFVNNTLGSRVRRCARHIYSRDASHGRGRHAAAKPRERPRVTAHTAAIPPSLAAHAT